MSERVAASIASRPEDFLVLSGEAVLIVEGRSARRRHDTRSPGPATAPCVLLCASLRQYQKDGPWGFYCADETAARYNASSPEDTQDGALACARFPPSRTTHYCNGLPPD